MINIWLPEDSSNPLLWNRLHSVVIDWDPTHRHCVSFASDLASSQWIVLLVSNDYQQQLAYIDQHGGIGDKKVIVLGLFHAHESMQTWYCPEPQTHEIVRHWRSNVAEGNLLFVDQNLDLKHNPVSSDSQFYDFLWHRQIVYFCQYSQYDLSSRIFSYNASASMYKLSPIEKNPVGIRHYLAAMRTYEHQAVIDHRAQIRQQLRQFLDHSKGYVSDHAKGSFIECQQWNEEIQEQSLDMETSGGKFWPAHNRYYWDSVISIYGETCTRSNGYRVVTEKTWDPLIKGNFILPYGYSGLIRDIKLYGFQLPDWIDYSYDQIPDDDHTIFGLRFQKYLESVQQVLDLDSTTLYNLYLKDRHILEYNRSVFFNHQRCSLIEQIIDKFNQ